ncbi:MAG TPA: DNA-3-methyladenine glycosylase [Alphaproteobacteria bacterium]
MTSKNDYARLDRAFFHRPTLEVAPELLGKTLVFGPHRGLITETEAYIGQDDPACHAARGKTKRNETMFGQAGLSYVYFIYGMYYCFNIVTEDEHFGAAVLIRGVLEPEGRHLNGPGKLCRDWGMAMTENGRDLVTDPDFYLLDTPSFQDYKNGPRIGISKGTEKDWRFWVDVKKLPSAQG